MDLQFRITFDDGYFNQRRSMVGDHRLEFEPSTGAVERFFSDVSSSLLLVVDEERRIIFANSKALAFVGLDETADPSDYKLGDFLGCVSAFGISTGCGTSGACPTCGLLRTITEASTGRTSEGEYSLRNRAGKSSIFRVKALGLVMRGRNVVAISMQDVSAEKRKEAMERVFYHDLLNSASGLTGLLELVDYDTSDQASNAEMIAMARMCAAQLIDEINFIRALSNAESDALVLNIRPVPVNHVIDKAKAFFSQLADSRRIVIKGDYSPNDFNILTDESIVVRVLVNLLKNAIEAEAAGATVSIGAKADKEAVLFEVHNDSVMPKSVKSQVFARAFSTKGKGRGIGTYSVQLFTENYLKGRVWFESENGVGTTFFVRIPVVAP
jgi:signal transduction histidine kinase